MAHNRTSEQMPTLKPENADQRQFTNPATGQPWRLTDPEIKAELDAEIREMRRDPKLATRFLREVGIVGNNGKLTKRFGG